MMLKHLDSLLELKGEHVAVLEMRSHGPWYLKGIDHASELRKQLSTARTKEEFKVYVEAFFNAHP
jgi:tRNA-dihydrouridine synthase